MPRSFRYFVLPLLWAMPLCAQQATLTGRITDSTGALIPSATVKATNQSTNVESQGVSNAEGYYTIPLLPPGNYTVAFTAAGFTNAERSGIRLDVQQVLRLDVAMQVGGVAQSVDVSATAQLLDASSSSLGLVIDGRRITELPLNGRNPLELARLTPGVQLLTSAFNDARNFRISAMSINGGPTGANAILLDGGSSTVPERNEYSVAPNVDAVEEFRVQTNSFSAEFGLTGGGVINLVTKSGTNRLKGTLYEFVRNDAFDANSWQRNRSSLGKPPLRYNQFGFTVGGPVWLPKIYNGRNRSFFFVNWEAIRYSTSAVTQTRVPTEMERRGDFRQTIINSTNAGLVPVTLFDPFSSTLVNGQIVRTPFPTAVLPASRIDPVAANVMKYFPAATGPGLDATARNNFIANVPNRTVTDQINLRFDHAFSAANKLFARYSQNHANAERQATYAPDNLADPGGAEQPRNNKNIVLGDTHIVTPSVFNEFRFSYTRQSLRSRPPGADQGLPAALGLPGTIPPYAFPSFSPGDIAGIGNFAGFYATRGMTVGQLSDNILWVRGRHTWKFGADLRTNMHNDYNPGALSGSFSFGRAATGNGITTNDITGFGGASFLLGAVTGGSISNAIAKAENYKNYSWFVQDDFKLSPRLTLNLGLRHDIITPFTERYDRYVTFDPSKPNAGVGGRPGSIIYAGKDFGRTVTSLDRNNLGPRVGFAWDVAGNSRTVLRGGYGMYYFHNAIREIPSTEGYSASTSFTGQQGLPAFQLKDGPPVVVQPVGSSLGSLLRLGNTVPGYQLRDMRTSYVQQWNFSVQRALPGRMMVDAAYAANRGVRLITDDYDMNQMDPRYLSLGAALDTFVANPFFAMLPDGAPLKTATVRQSQLLRPLPYFSTVNVLAPKFGSSTYHSFQLRVERRMTRGFSAQLAFTGSKKISDAGRGVIDNGDAGLQQLQVTCGQAVAYDRRACRAIEGDDISRILNVSYVWDLPFGRGKAYLNHGVASWILGGWQTNGIYTYRTGQPLAVRGGVTNGAADRPDYLRSARLDHPTILQWFDTTAFGLPANYTYGNAPRTLPDVRGPGYNSFDLALFKNFNFTENVRFQFRVETFNVLNHVNYGLPNTTFRSTAFGRVETALDPRQVQFGAKLYF